MTQKALKHLKAITEAFGPDAGIELDQKAWAKLHTAIKEVLAQPEQEPVAYSGNGTAGREADVRPTGFFFQMPQRTWVGLTDDEIAQGCKESWVTEQAWQSAVWWAEDKLRNKNT